MDELLKQVGESGGLLALLIPSIVQLLKRVPVVVKLNTDGYPVYELAAIALGIAGAFALGLPNAVVAGIVAGLAAGKGYDIVRGKESGTAK